MNLPLISLCIPTYKQPDLLYRTLTSVAKQTYKNLEVVISDDSPDASIQDVCITFSDRLTIRYFKNITPLGSPKNWNNCIDKANGDYYMLLHHDDWFEDINALQKYINAFSIDDTVDAVFSKNNPRYTDLTEGDYKLDRAIIKNLASSPDYLIISNQVGPPSNLLLSAKVKERYDEKLLWLVDVEFYIRLLKKSHKFSFIDEQLLNIGLHDEQITAFCQDRPDIIVKENILLGFRAEESMWKQIRFYDYFWRLLRNNRVKSIQVLREYGVAENEIPGVIERMVHHQENISSIFLNFGPTSKALMFISYLKQKS